MKRISMPVHSAVARAMAAAVLTMAVTTSATAPVHAQSQQNATTTIDLSVGRGRLITLPSPMTDVFVADDKVADVQVRAKNQLYIFGQGPGETSIYATDAAGRVVFSVIARVGQNIESVDQMLKLAMPDAAITASTMNGFVLLTGTVASPDDAEEAERLAQAFVGDKTKVLSRLRLATPLQVNLQVKIAEVNRSLVKEIGGALTSTDRDGSLGNGLLGMISRGRTAGTITYNQDANGNVTGTTYAINASPTGLGTIAGAGRLFGLDMIAALDIGEKSGLVTTLAQPNLTALSGETADFLAGGEFPVPIPNGISGTTIEYRKYGVSLAYTPTVLSNGRISLRVRPEVSELSSDGAVRMQGIDIPALTIRRAETTVELGSGESFMIAGLMNNRALGAIDKVPGVGDIPVLGTLFKSDSFRRGETELVIIVTPYLVKPVSANEIKLPTDGYRMSDDASRVLLGKMSDGVTGGDRPKPKLEATLPSAGSADRRQLDYDVTPGFTKTP